MSILLRVAVCTQRAPAEVRESLSALRGQVGAERLALVTSGLAPAEVEAHRSAHSGPLLVEPRPGLSRARNRALAWCEDDEEAIAFVDDDAVVAGDWHEALVRRWDEAGPEIGCIGGPIRPRYAAEPPAWLSDPLLPALTLLDHGPEVRELDPLTTTVYGANISFRVAALRAIGGFDPAFGHSGSTVFFSEEDEAQRAIARLGWRVRYVPDVEVEHVIPAERLTRSSFLRRRFAYGAALGIRGGRARWLALRQLVSSGLGCLPAALRGRDALLMERAVRTAENLGVLVGPLAARRRG